MSLPSPSYTDLEIRIFGCQPRGYPVEITLGGEQEYPRGWLPAALGQWISCGTPEEDGDRLFAELFRDPNLLAAWSEARGRAGQRRVRLRIDPEAAELNRIPWECLADAASPDTPFSRYLPVAMPWQGVVGERPIRILVVISNPADLRSRFHLGQVEVDQERTALEESFQPLGELVQVDYLTGDATLEAIEARLREEYHVLHYVGHGLYNSHTHQGALLLQGGPEDSRNGCIIADDLLAGMLAHLPARPRLVFLVACQSAAQAGANPFLGMAPRLVSAGVPAVVAMQGLLTTSSGKIIARNFYRRLAEHGQVDRALNETRASLVTAGRPDAHIPVLYMRLKSGALWSDESNARGRVLTKGPAGQFWPPLMLMIKKRLVVPILGPRVRRRWLPSPAEVARQLGEKAEYPFSSQDVQTEPDLARVGQYIATSSGEGQLALMYLDEVKRGLARRIAADRDARDWLETGSLSETILKLNWAEIASADPNELHFLLAALGLPLYLTANPDNMLEEALRSAGRAAAREQCLWNDQLALLSPAGEGENEQPTAARPLVYHLLGVDEDLNSLVISEDQYFRYLYNIAAFPDRISRLVRGRIAVSGILFVGFSLYDWEFRVIMHGLVKTVKNSFNFNHVAVQLDESDRGGANEEKVQEFLSEYFSACRTNVYWGSTEQFTAELRENWQRTIATG